MCLFVCSCVALPIRVTSDPGARLRLIERLARAEEDKQKVFPLLLMWFFFPNSYFVFLFFSVWMMLNYKRRWKLKSAPNDKNKKKTLVLSCVFCYAFSQ